MGFNIIEIEDFTKTLLNKIRRKKMNFIYR